MGNENSKSEPSNRSIADEPSYETSIGIESESETLSSSSDMNDLLYFEFRYSNGDSTRSPPPILVSDEVNDDVQLDIDIADTAEVRMIDSAPQELQENKIPTPRKITAVKFEPNEVETDDDYVIMIEPSAPEEQEKSNDRQIQIHLKGNSDKSLSEKESQSELHRSTNSSSISIPSLLNQEREKHKEESNSSLDIEMGEAIAFKHVEPSNQSVDEKPPTVTKYEERSASKTMPNEGKCSTNDPDSNSCKQKPIDMENTSDGIEEPGSAKKLEIMPILQTLDELEIDRNSPKLDGNVQSDSKANDTEESLENESGVKPIDVNQRRLNSSDQKLNEDDEMGNDEPTQDHLKRRLHRVSSSDHRRKRRRTHPSTDLPQRCKYQKNYIHIKGNTVFLEIGVPKNSDE